MTQIDNLKHKLKELRLNAMSGQLEEVLQVVKQNNLDFLGALERLMDIELEYRHQAAVKRKFQQSKLREKITIDGFDFNHHKSREDQKARILDLLNLEFIGGKMDVIIIGNPGTGKTFLAKAIAFAACQANIKVLFTTAIDMINQLIAAQADYSLLKKLQYYQSPDLLCLDELGYLALGEQGSDLFFQVISHRHQQKSTLLTTNLRFADWGKVFNSTTAATAIADRLVYHSEVLIMEGGSYRRRPNT